MVVIVNYGTSPFNFLKYSTDTCAFIDIIYNLPILRHLSEHENIFSIEELLKKEILEVVHFRYWNNTLTVGTDFSLDFDECLRNSPTIAIESKEPHAKNNTSTNDLYTVI